MRRIEQMCPSTIQHGPPTWRRGVNAESKKAESGFGENGPSHAQRRLDGHRGKSRGNDVLRENPWCSRSERPRGLNEFELARTQHLAAYQPRVADPSDQRPRANDRRHTT